MCALTFLAKWYIIMIETFLFLCVMGQHYMLNSDINDQLAAAAKVKEGDFVLEIGPGTGSLTNVLLNLGASVLAIDKVSYIPQIFVCLFVYKQALLILSFATKFL